MNEILYQQTKKIKALTEFAADFHEVYDIQEAEMEKIKEQCLVERAATTALKAGSQNPTYDQVLFKTSALRELA
jgi:hypothetical protein